MAYKVNQQTGALEDDGLAPGELRAAPPVTAAGPTPLNLNLAQNFATGGAPQLPSAPAIDPATIATAGALAQQQQGGFDPLSVTAPAGATVQGSSDTRTNSTKTTQASAEEKVAVQESRKADESEIAAVKRKGELEAQKAELDAKKEEQIQQSQNEAAARRAQFEDAGNKEYAARMAQADAEYTKYKSMDLHDYWDTEKGGRSTANRFGSAIAVALGAIGAGMSGNGKNYALDIINNDIERDAARQRDSILKQKDIAERSGAGAGAYRGSIDRQLKELDVKQAAVEARIAQDFRAQGAKLSSPEKRAEAERTAAQLDTQSFQRMQKFAEVNRKEITAGGTHTTTSKDPRDTMAGLGAGLAGLKESQGKSADLGGRMLQDYQTLKSVPPISEKGRKDLLDIAQREALYEKYPSLKLAAIKTGAYRTPEESLSDNDRLAYQAGNRIAASVLRGDSGAAISLGEYVSWAKQNLPVAGDKPRDIEAKDRSMQKMIEGRMLQAGPLAAPMLHAAREEGTVSGAVPPSNDIVTVTNQKTGATMRARRMPDGSLHPVQ